MNYYLKSCYKSDILWNRVTDFTNAIDSLISWSGRVDLHGDDAHELSLLGHETIVSKFEQIRENSEK